MHLFSPSPALAIPDKTGKTPLLGVILISHKCGIPGVMRYEKNNLIMILMSHNAFEIIETMAAFGSSAEPCQTACCNARVFPHAP